MTVTLTSAGLLQAQCTSSGFRLLRAEVVRCSLSRGAYICSLVLWMAEPQLDLAFRPCHWRSPGSLELLLHNREQATRVGYGFALSRRSSNDCWCWLLSLSHVDRHHSRLESLPSAFLICCSHPNNNPAYFLHAIQKGSDYSIGHPSRVPKQSTYSNINTTSIILECLMCLTVSVEFSSTSKIFNVYTSRLLSLLFILLMDEVSTRRNFGSRHDLFIWNWCAVTVKRYTFEEIFFPHSKRKLMQANVPFHFHIDPLLQYHPSGQVLAQ